MKFKIPNHSKTRKRIINKERKKSHWISAHLQDISVRIFIASTDIRGGSLFEKKSLSAVATALTGMSKSLMDILASIQTQVYHDLLISITD